LRRAAREGAGPRAYAPPSTLLFAD